MSFTQDVLDSLAPMLYAESQTGNALTAYIGGLCSVFELVEEWASDTSEHIGWSLILDVDRCPNEALPWLAQIVGLTLPPGLIPADQRQQIKDVANWKRGTLNAIKAAPAPYLIGNKTVIVRERYNGTTQDAPYYIEVITYQAETPNPAAVEAAIRAQKAAGVILTYVNAIGQDWQSVKDHYATWQDVKNHYPTWADVKADMVP